jgi:uncharacterized protein involved in exopolysaccharide biosynthesis
VEQLHLNTVDQLSLRQIATPAKDSLRLRDFVAIVFRRRRLVALCFWTILLGAVIAAILQPDRYASEMKILVKRERADPMVTSEPSAVQQIASGVTEEELNSEVELLRTRDLLEKVVRARNLQDQHYPSWSKVFAIFGANGKAKRSSGEEARVQRAVTLLQKNLSIEVMRKTNLIQVGYESSDAITSAQVLNTLADLYLQKHLDVHRPSGAFDFFHQEAERYRKGLAEAQAKLVEFNRRKNVISSQLEKEAALQKFTEFQSAFRKTEGSVAETEQRISELQEQLPSIPPRMITQVRKMDDAALLSQLRASLVALELKHTELLQKFEPNYRPVQELEAQIDQTRAALSEAEKVQVHEETTDQDPAHLIVREEIAKAQAELAGLRALQEATAESAQIYRHNARSLESKEIVQNDLLRTVKADEERYLLYLNKEEEARISEALDRRRIINVAVAEAATVLPLPSNHRPLTLLVGLLLAIVLSFGVAWTSEYLDPTFRTPDEVKAFLNVTVLAALPKESNSKSGICGMQLHDVRGASFAIGETHEKCDSDVGRKDE